MRAARATRLLFFILTNHIFVFRPGQSPGHLSKNASPEFKRTSKNSKSKTTGDEIYESFLGDQFLERRLSHQCSPLHIFSGVYLSFPFFLFLETFPDICGRCSGCDHSLIHMTLLLTAFRALFSKTESKENNLYTHLVEFRKRPYKHQLLLMSIALSETPNETQTKFGRTQASHFFEDYYYPVFSQKRIIHK